MSNEVKTEEEPTGGDSLLVVGNVEENKAAQEEGESAKPKCTSGSGRSEPEPSPEADLLPATETSTTTGEEVIPEVSIAPEAEALTTGTPLPESVTAAVPGASAGATAAAVPEASAGTASHPESSSSLVGPDPPLEAAPKGPNPEADAKEDPAPEASATKASEEVPAPETTAKAPQESLAAAEAPCEPKTQSTVAAGTGPLGDLALAKELAPGESVQTTTPPKPGTSTEPATVDGASAASAMTQAPAPAPVPAPAPRPAPTLNGAQASARLPAPIPAPVPASAPQGQAPEGQAPEGQAPEGQAPEGQAPEGQAPEGQAPEGQAPEGQAPEGQAPQAPQGQAPQGHAPQGHAPQGQAPQGQAPQGQAPQGQAPVASAAPAASAVAPAAGTPKPPTPTPQASAAPVVPVPTHHPGPFIHGPVLPPPLRPTERDIVVDDGEIPTKGNLLLQDLITLHKLCWGADGGKEQPKTEDDVSDLANHIFRLMKYGKELDFAGLKDVPRPFLRGIGRFFRRETLMSWAEISDVEAKTYVAKKIMASFGSSEANSLAARMSSFPKYYVPTTLVETEERTPKDALVSPDQNDVIFLRGGQSPEFKPYEYQCGNRSFFNLVSQHVSAEANDTVRRVGAVITVVTSPIEINTGNDTELKHPRFLVQKASKEAVGWMELDRLIVAEMSLVFVFEVYLEKEVHSRSTEMPIMVVHNGHQIIDISQPSTMPIDVPTAYDVLFGRGGMTNSHPGNRRFRDIIALHRPDYIRAIKVDKPNVARKIVRAIRHGSPPGRFLKKSDDGKWYDVGDRCAAEKTSQGLRERTNQEKRQRSAMREALKIRKEDLVFPEEPPSKKVRLSDSTEQLGAPGPSPALVQHLNYAGTNMPVPLSLTMKETSPDSNAKRKYGRVKSGTPSRDGSDEPLPPNAVDEQGNILVTDYDILCGRGGLTNHHKGNKRFRDIVALHRPDYVRAPKIQKPSVARVIVRAIRNGDPPGRFLKKDSKTGQWFDIGDKRAAEKTSQALREKSNEEKDHKEGGTVPGVPTPIAPMPTYPAPGVAAESGTPAAAKGAPVTTKAAPEPPRPAASQEGTQDTADDAREIRAMCV